MYGPQGIRVNAVAPGGVATGIPMPAAPVGGRLGPPAAVPDHDPVPGDGRTTRRFDHLPALRRRREHQRRRRWPRTAAGPSNNSRTLVFVATTAGSVDGRRSFSPRLKEVQLGLPMVRAQGRKVLRGYPLRCRSHGVGLACAAAKGRAGKNRRLKGVAPQ